MSDFIRIAELVRFELAVNLDIVECDGAVYISRGQENVALADASALVDETPLGRRLLRDIASGRAMVILLGEVQHDQIRILIEKGVYEVQPGPPDPLLLANAVRNAFDLQRLRFRFSASAIQIRRNRHELREFIDTARAINSVRNIDALLDTILERCREITGADAGTLYLIEGTGPIEERKLRFKLAQNDSIHLDVKEFVIPVSSSSMAGAAALRREVINIPDVRHMPLESGLKHDMSIDERTGYYTRSVLSAPLVSMSDEVIGVVQLLNRKQSPQTVLIGVEDFDEQVLPFDARCVEVVRILSSHAAVSLENALLYNDISQILEGFVKASVHAIEQRDPPTSGHSERVKDLTLELARCVENAKEGPYADVVFSDQELLELKYATLLHDFGKIGVPEAVLTKQKKLPERGLAVISQRFESARLSLQLRHQKRVTSQTDDDKGRLRDEVEAGLERLRDAWELILRANEPALLKSEKKEALVELAHLTYSDSIGVDHPLLTEDELHCLGVKRGSLTPEEFGQIQAHAEKTDQFLSMIPWGRAFPDLPLIASSHHERPDGTGYPQGLDERKIPLKAKMMAVADIFDALTAADRPYKKAVPLERALRILEMESEANHLDSELVRLFCTLRVYECLSSMRPDDS